MKYSKATQLLLNVKYRPLIGRCEIFAFRNLNRRTACLERFALLVSVDSFRSLPATQDSPLGYRFLRSQPCENNCRCRDEILRKAQDDIRDTDNSVENSAWMALFFGIDGVCVEAV